MKKFIALSCLSLSISLSAYANDCEKYEVYIANNTQSTWSLSNVTANKGSLIFTSETIPPGSVGVIKSEQYFVGPDITATLSDGSHTEVINAHQNYCFMEAGDITTSVSPGVYVHTGSNTPGSYWFGHAGVSHFSISNP